VSLPSEPANSKLWFPLLHPKKEAKRGGRRIEIKLSEADRRRVLILKREHGVSVAELAERFQTSTQNIRRILDSDA
jgi:DNA-directed RNA polymerase specialized sigma24 family protein